MSLPKQPTTHQAFVRTGEVMSDHMTSMHRPIPDTWLGRPPIPHEHGAWVILYAPVMITLLALHRLPDLRILLLLIAVTGAFLARNAAGLLVRKRGKRGNGLWLGLFLAITILAVAPLVLYWHVIALLRIGAYALFLFVLHTLLLAPARRLDRSQWGEILAVGALALTGPAAYVVYGGQIDGVAWCLWAACTLFFSSSVFFVKMLLAAVKIKGEFDRVERWRAGRDNLIYHGLLALIVLWIAHHLGGVDAILVIVAYLPVVIRAILGWARLSRRPPPLKRVGVAEIVYALWFVGCFGATFWV